MKSIIAIAGGAGLGALLRWWLGLTLNSHFPTIPPGTIGWACGAAAVHLTGSVLMTLAGIGTVAWFRS